MTKVVITAAGRGTRLLPFTKEMPKEMMPIFSNINSKKIVLPLLQYVYDQLYSMSFRDYCFIVGREKRSIEDHFTPDEMYLRDLFGDNKKIITKFYEKLEKSHLVWINQNKPMGFGDAVKCAEGYVGKEDFIVHAGDVTILSRDKHPVLRLIETAKKNPDAKAILLCKKVKDFKRYGVPTVDKINKDLFNVREVIEKPNEPKSNFGIFLKKIKFLLKDKGMTIIGVKMVLKSDINKLDGYNSHSLKAHYFKNNIKTTKNLLNAIKSSLFWIWIRYQLQYRITY